MTDCISTLNTFPNSSHPKPSLQKPITPFTAYSLFREPISSFSSETVDGKDLTESVLLGMGQVHEPYQKVNGFQNALKGGNAMIG